MFYFCCLFTHRVDYVEHDFVGNFLAKSNDKKCKDGVANGVETKSSVEESNRNEEFLCDHPQEIAVGLHAVGMCLQLSCWLNCLVCNLLTFLELRSVGNEELLRGECFGEVVSSFVVVYQATHQQLGA